MQPLLNLNILQKPLLYTFDAVSMLALLYLIAGPVRLAPSAPLSPPVGRPASGRYGPLLIRVALLAGGALVGAITLYVCEAWYNIFGVRWTRTPMPGSFPPSQPSGWRWRTAAHTVAA